MVRVDKNPPWLVKMRLFEKLESWATPSYFNTSHWLRPCNTRWSLARWWVMTCWLGFCITKNAFDLFKSVIKFSAVCCFYLLKHIRFLKFSLVVIFVKSPAWKESLSFCHQLSCLLIFIQFNENLKSLFSFFLPSGYYSNLMLVDCWLWIQLFWACNSISIFLFCLLPPKV